MKLTTRWIVTAIVGIVLVTFASSYQNDMLNPGPVTVAHSGVKNCSTCHSALDHSPMSWPLLAFTRSSEEEDSQRCTACHQFNESAMLPHGLPEATLQAVSAGVVKLPSNSAPLLVSLSSAMTTPKHREDGQLPCMTCHQEHRGLAADLTAISNARCTGCHQNKFADFANGHPDFSNYPFSRRTMIKFDHNNHFTKHFREKVFSEKAPTGCNECHKPSPDGTAMVLQGFDGTCAGCHGAQIEGDGRATAKGIAILGVPGLDVYTLYEQEIAVGTWPIDSEDDITPFMDLLLSIDPAYVEARAILEDADPDYLDLTDMEPEVFEAVSILAWEVKELFFDLRVEGIVALRNRLEQVFGRALSTSELASFSGLLSADSLGTAIDAWFPKLFGEILAHRANEDLELFDPDAEDDSGNDEDESVVSIEIPAPEDWAAAGGWYREEFTLYFRPTGHEDPLLKTWLEAAASASENAGSQEVFDLLVDPKSPGRCIKCHSVDRLEGAMATVNWSGVKPVENRHNFTVFRHTSHFSLLDEEGCLLCHDLNPETNVMDNFKDPISTALVSNFKPIKRTSCTGCHPKTEPGAGCLTCHNYHIGTFPPALISAPKAMANKAAEP